MFYVKCEEGSGTGEKIGTRHSEKKREEGAWCPSPDASAVCPLQKRKQRLEQIAFVASPLTLHDVALPTFT